MSSSVVRRRGWRFLATTLALSFGSLAVPAAALADGAIDTSFNGSGYHFASADGQDGISLDPVVDRVPTVRVATVVQSDGKIVIGGRSADDFMTLVRYNADGSLDTSFGTGGFVRRAVPGHARHGRESPGAWPKRRGCDDAGCERQHVRRRQRRGASEFVAEFSAAGDYVSSAVCYAPQNVAYTPRAIALRADGSIVIAGAARDRRLDPDGVHARTMYGAARCRDATGQRQQHNRLRCARALARIRRRHYRRPRARRHGHGRCAQRSLVRRRRRAARQPLRRRFDEWPRGRRHRLVGTALHPIGRARCNLQRHRARIDRRRRPSRRGPARRRLATRRRRESAARCCSPTSPTAAPSAASRR